MKQRGSVSVHRFQRSEAGRVVRQVGLYLSQSSLGPQS